MGCRQLACERLNPAVRRRSSSERPKTRVAASTDMRENEVAAAAGSGPVVAPGGGSVGEAVAADKRIG